MTKQWYLFEWYTWNIMLQDFRSHYQ